MSLSRGITGAFAALYASLLLIGEARALELMLPANARQTGVRDSALDAYAAPITPYEPSRGRAETRVVEGMVQRAAWRISSSGLTALQVLQPLRAQLVEAGFSVQLECDQATCGGFDFRFGTEVLPAPNMRVNLRAFRFLTATMGPAEAPERVITLMVSTTATAAYVQIIKAGGPPDARVVVQPQGADILPLAAPAAPAPAEAEDFATRLRVAGRHILTGLDFETGTSDLGTGPFEVLQALADFMDDNPAVKIVLVGHTDSVGGLEGNIVLSQRRAAAVGARLAEDYGVDADRITAEGAGFLAPVTSHLNAAGREVNRRVEAVLLSE